MQLHYMTLILWLLHSQVNFILGEDAIATIFTDTGHDGEMMIIKTQSCLNLTSPFDNSVQSINTHGGGCIALHDLKGCTGDFIEVRLSTPGHWNLAKINFADRASSIGPCEDCQKLMDKQKLEFPISTYVALYTEKYFKGTPNEMKNITGCTPIPLSLRNQAMSAITDKNCYELYQKPDCTGETRELSLGTSELFHNFDELEFDGRTAAISICHYRCQVELNMSTSIPSPTEIGRTLTSSTSSVIANTPTSPSILNFDLWSEIHPTSISSSTPSPTAVNSTMPHPRPTEIEASSTSSSNKGAQLDAAILELNPIDNLGKSTSSQNQGDSSEGNTTSDGVYGVAALLVSLAVLIIIVLIFLVRRRRSSSEMRGSSEDVRFSLIGSSEF